MTSCFWNSALHRVPVYIVFLFVSSCRAYVCAHFRVETYTSEKSDLWRKVEKLETANK